MPSKINKILQKLDRSRTPVHLQADQAIAFYDEPMKEAFDDDRRFAWFYQRVRYLVTTGQTVAVEDLVFPLRSPNAERRLKVKVDCRVSCIAGEHLKMVKALVSNDSPQSDLDKLILSLIEAHQNQLIETGRDPVLGFFDYKPDWEKFVVRELEQRAGLQAVVRFDIGADGLKCLQVNSGFQEVRVAGCRQPVQFRIMADLEICPNHRLKAMLSINDQNDLLKEIEQQAVRFLKDETKCDIGKFCQRTRELEGELKTLTQNLVQSYGRQVMAFQLDVNTPFKNPDFGKPFIEAIPCQIPRWGEPVTIKHEVKLDLIDLGAYMQLVEEKRTPEQWVRETLAAVTHGLVYERAYEYADLATKFTSFTGRRVNSQAAQVPTIELEIRERMEEQGRKVGLAIRQYSSLPDVEAIRLQHHFRLEVEDEFSTKHPRVKVRLHATVEGQVIDPELEKIRPYLKPGVHLVNHVFDPQVRETLQSNLTPMSPKRFHLEFDHHALSPLDYEETRAPRENPSLSDVEQELVRSVEQKMRDQFDAETRVTIRLIDTPILQRLRGLTNRDEEFAAPYDDRISGRVCTGFYQVYGVHPEGWPRFLDGVDDFPDKQNHHPAPERAKAKADEEIAKITAFIERCVSNFFNKQIREEVLNHLGPEENRAVLDRLCFDPEDGLYLAVIRRFGLVIQVYGIHRDVSLLEEAQRDSLKNRIAETRQVEQEKIAAKRSRLAKLRDAYQDLLPKSDSEDIQDQEKLAFLDKQIRAEEQELDEITGVKDSLPMGEQPIRPRIAADVRVQEETPVLIDPRTGARRERKNLTQSKQSDDSSDESRRGGEPLVHEADFEVEGSSQDTPSPPQPPKG